MEKDVDGHLVDLVAILHDHPKFLVSLNGYDFKIYEQRTGIRQGCPLSPYLFIIMMSIILQDAREIRGSIVEKPYIVSPDIVYADDTMLLGSSASDVQKHLDAVVSVGRSYGLELNLGKTLLLRINGKSQIYGSDGNALKVCEEAVYLGGMISCDGRSSAEITRRLGEARSTFLNLVAIWKHANLTSARKKEVFDACVVSKLLYGLESNWVLQVERDKLDAFYAQCLRKIAGISHSYYSRVSNRTVLGKFGSLTLSKQLFARQLLYFGHVATLPEASLVRQATLQANLPQPRQWDIKRSVGRPRLRWTGCVYAMALDLAGGSSELGHLLDSPGQRAWKQAVKQYVST